MKTHMSLKYMACMAMMIATMALSACSNMSQQQQRVVSGAGIGAGAGALVGAATGGSPGTGAAIGAAAGAAGGYLYDQGKK